MQKASGISKMKTANLKETRKQNGGIRFFPRRETETFFFSTHAVVRFLAQTSALNLSVGTLVICSLTT